MEPGVVAAATTVALVIFLAWLTYHARQRTLVTPTTCHGPWLVFLAVVVGAAITSAIITAILSNDDQELAFQRAAAIAACEIASGGIYPCEVVVNAAIQEAQEENQNEGGGQ